MVIIGTMSYPTEAAKEVAKRYLTLKKLPTHITMRGPYLQSSKGVGIEVLNFYGCERSKIPDAYDLIGARYATFIGVPGFTYAIQVWFDADEALKMIDMGE